MKLAHLVGWLAAVTSLPSALALELPDPTRPPAGFGQQAVGGLRMPAAHGGGDAQPTAAASAPDRPKTAPAVAVSRSARLSAVMLADLPGRDAAVIDGDVRHVGDKVRDGATVLAISAAAVTLRDPKGRSVRLTLFGRSPEPDAQPDPSPKSPPRTSPEGPRPATAASALADEASALSLSTPTGAQASGKEQP